VRPSVRSAYLKFTSKFEGTVPFLYCDVLGLVTIARGSLVDPISAALFLPLQRPDGTRANQNEIAAAWRIVKSRQDLCSHGGMAYGGLTTLRLTPAAMDTLTFDKLDAIEAQLVARFSGYTAWPADAQLGLLSMSWAMGAGFHFPRFALAVAQQDFATAAVECQIGQPPVPHERNAANALLFRNAAAVVSLELDYDTLYYPMSAQPLDAA
jgi:hypothetical protein